MVSTIKKEDLKRIIDMLESDVYGVSNKLSYKKVKSVFENANEILIELKIHDVIEDFKDGIYFINIQKLQELLKTS
jgi:hypothetical protein